MWGDNPPDRLSTTGIYTSSQSMFKYTGFSVKIKGHVLSQLTVSFEKKPSFGIAGNRQRTVNYHS